MESLYCTPSSASHTPTRLDDYILQKSIASYHRLAGQSFPVPNHPSSDHQSMSRMIYQKSPFSSLPQSPLFRSKQDRSSQTSNISEPSNTWKRKRDLMQMQEVQQTSFTTSFLGGSSPLSSSPSCNYSRDSSEDEDDVFCSKKLLPRPKKRKIVLKSSYKGGAKETTSQLSYESSGQYQSSNGDKDRITCGDDAKLEDDEDESIKCANVLMSLGHGRADRIAIQHVSSLSKRSKRAARRAGEKSHMAHPNQFPKLSYEPYQAPKKTYDIRSAESVRSRLSNDDYSPPHRPSLSETGIRTFPSDMAMEFKDVKMLKAYPMLYRKFRVPSLMVEEARAEVFGVSCMEEVRVIENVDLRQAAARGFKKIAATFKEPETLFDLYSPRYTRGIGSNKEGLCPICYEEGHSIWLKTKTSQYNYHLTVQHGISAKTFLPMDPPIAYQIKAIKYVLNGERKDWMLQGKCHACGRYIDMESVRDGGVNVPEIYFWKHAKQCHQRSARLEGTGGTFVEDELYHRAVRYELGRKSKE